MRSADATWGDRNSAQTIFRVAYRHKPYSQIGNAMLRDERLSPEATHVLVYVLSMPITWRVNLEQIASRRRMGRDRMQKAVRELLALGYCKRTRTRGNGGRLGPYEYVFSDEPQHLEEPQPDDQVMAPVLTKAGRPVTGHPAPVVQAPYKGKKVERLSPPPPSARVSEQIQLLEELKAEAGDANIIEWFFKPVLFQRPLVQAPNPLYALRYLTAEFADLSDPQLATAARRVLEERKVNVKPGDLQEALSEARRSSGKSGRQSVIVSKTLTPDAYQAWLSHAKALGDESLVTKLEQGSTVELPSLFPPSLSDRAALAHREVLHG